MLSYDTFSRLFLDGEMNTMQDAEEGTHSESKGGNTLVLIGKFYTHAGTGGCSLTAWHSTEGQQVGPPGTGKQEAETGRQTSQPTG